MLKILEHRRRASEFYEDRADCPRDAPARIGFSAADRSHRTALRRGDVRFIFRDLEIPKPDFHLEVGSQSHAVQTARIMTAFEPVVLQEKPDWVLVVGDVNSTIACALVCAKLGIKVAHVEAGLRSRDRTMPEEINRILTDAISDLLLDDSRGRGRKSESEGVAAEKIKFVGNVMIDSLFYNLKKAETSTCSRRFEL